MSAPAVEFELNEAPVKIRVAGVDEVRGLAVACMIVDHVAIAIGGPLALVLRLTVGRAAMPLFFLTAGRCSGRLRLRHAGVAVAGLLLPLAAPWVDAPNVLVWWAVGAALLWLLPSRYALVLPLLALGLAGNHWLWSPGSSYPPLVLLGLMGLGAVLPWSAFSWGARLPAGRLLAFLGRHALPIYLGHVVLLTWLYLALGGL